METEEAMDAQIGEKKRFLKEILRVMFGVCGERTMHKKIFG